MRFPFSEGEPVIRLTPPALANNLRNADWMPHGRVMEAQVYTRQHHRREAGLGGWRRQGIYARPRRDNRKEDLNGERVQELRKKHEEMYVHV